jgi:AcrR family transcriptional regulator
VTGRAPTGGALHRPRVTSAIREAALEELAAQGYARLSMDAVARRAGVGKAAIYRRWSSKLTLVGDLISDVFVPPGATVAETLVGDLHGLMTSFAALLSTPQLSSVMADLASEAQRSPELSQRIEETVGGPYRSRITDLVDRAIGRGELPPGLDREAALDLTLSSLYWRVVVRRLTLKPGDLDLFAAAVAAGLAALTRADAPT